MNDALTAQYLHSIIGSLSFTKRLLVWDAYRCHTSEATRAEVLRMGLHTAIVPGGCTKFIQAADVVWNACFKGHLRSRYDSWLAEPAGHQYTRGGNMKPPPRSLLCEWVKFFWDVVPIEMVIKSFTSCAITTSTDGSDDHEIHCFKEGQPCEEGRTLLTEKMEALVSGCSQDDDTDPFLSDTDDEEQRTMRYVLMRTKTVTVMMMLKRALPLRMKLLHNMAIQLHPIIIVFDS